MQGMRFQLAERPWLSLPIIILAMPIGQVLAGGLVIGLFRQPLDAQMTQTIVALLGHLAVLFVFVPFVLLLPRGTRSFSGYLNEIRLIQVQPFPRLLLLGLSCYLILALCQVSGTLVYRVLEGKVITWPFVRGMLDLSGQLPPKSWDLLFSFPSVFEEVAFRGVILALTTTSWTAMALYGWDGDRWGRWEGQRITITTMPGETVWEAFQRTMQADIDQANRDLDRFLAEELHIKVKSNVIVITAVLLGGLPAVLAGGIASLGTTGDAPLFIAMALGIPIFLLVMVVPLSLLAGLREAFLSSLWALTYRQVRPAGAAQPKPLPTG